MQVRSRFLVRLGPSYCSTMLLLSAQLNQCCAYACTQAAMSHEIRTPLNAIIGVSWCAVLSDCHRYRDISNVVVLRKNSSAASSRPSTCLG